MATTPAAGEILCPDPSAHDHSQRISDSASKAALLAAGAARTERTSTSSDNLLTEDGKLSSSRAAQSLKYAKAQDLPSFPSCGATSGAAFAAAVLAKDHTMKELWQPEATVAGTKAAAKAQKDGGQLDLWQPSPSAAGNSAAVLAMRGKDLSPQIDYGYTDAGRSNSLSAAKQSHISGRQRAGSVPAVPAPQYPDSHNSTKNALNAAMVSHRTSKMAPDGWDSEANQAARIRNLGGRMDPTMFGEHPPVEPELEEQRRQAALRASAVSMAKQMYDPKNRAATPTEASSVSGGAGAGAEVAHRRNQSSTSQADLKEEALKYINLQDAAHRIAQERLAKLDKEMSDARYREYYGYGDTSPKKSRLSSIRRRPRASSDGDRDLEDSDDERQARRIRNQTAQLSSGLNTVDLKQRQSDRAKLMAAAEKRVHDRMHDMDEKVFQDTGRVSQSMMDGWEAKAREKAEEQKVDREITSSKTAGKTHVGGGKYMDQAEIEAIAAARLKPTLEEINETAEKMRARDEEVRRQQDLQHTAQMEQKMKDSQQKAEFKRIRDQEKAAARKEKEERAEVARKEKEERKAAERAQKEEAKARRSEEKRKSREAKTQEAAVVAGGAAVGEVADKVKADKEREEEQDREATLAGSAALSEVATKVKEDKEREERRDQEATVAAGAALGEVADKLKQEQTREEEKNREATVAAGDAVGEVAEKLKREQTMEEEKEREATDEAGVTIMEVAQRVKANKEVEDKRKSRERRRSSAAAAAGGATLAEVAEKVKQDREAEAAAAQGRQSEDDHWGRDTAVAVSAAGAAGVAGVAGYEAIHEEDTGPASNTVGHHDSDLANIVDPRVKPDPETQRAVVDNPETGPAPNTVGPHSSDIANVLDPRVQPEPKVQQASVTRTDTGPAPSTIGPHRSDLMNILDPRVQPDSELQRSKEPVTSGPWKSDMANKLDPHVDSEKNDDDDSRGAGVAVAAGAATGAGIAVAADQDNQGKFGEFIEEPKRKSSTRGMFTSIRDRFKRRGDEKTSKPTSSDSPTTKEEPDQPEEGAEVAAAPALATGLAAAGGIEEEQARGEERDQRDVLEDDEDDDDDIDRSRAAEALIGVTGAGAGVAAAVAAASSGHDEEVARDEVSSLSTEGENDDAPLEQYTTAEHDGSHTFAGPSPPVERRRLVLERHISTIDTSSDESEDLPDSDDEADDETEQRGRVSQAQEVTIVPAEAPVTRDIGDAGPSQNEWGAYERAGKGKVATEGELENKFATYDLNDPNPERTEEMKEQIRKLEQDKEEMVGAPPEEPVGKEREGLMQKILEPFRPKDEEKEAAAPAEDAPRSPVSPVLPDEIVIVNEGASADDTPLVVADAPAGAVPSASAPAAATRSVEEEPEASPPQKERKGIKGLLSKLTSKPETKLTKRTQDAPEDGASATSEGGSFVGGAKLTGGDDKDGVVSPVTTTAMGAAENLGLTGGTVGETHGLTDISSASAAAARDASPSSFKRHEEDLGDLDDASSSGVDEEEVKRGRAGRLARKLGLSRGKGKETGAGTGGIAVQTSNLETEDDGGEEHFEEARDHFDESVAPQPAFAAQAGGENQSPARNTKFQEQF